MQGTYKALKNNYLHSAKYFDETPTFFDENTYICDEVI
jgi:hypothetical protein